MSNTISARLVEDMKTAMRAKEAVTLNMVRNLKSAMKYAAIEKYGAEGDLEEAEAVTVVRKQIKQREDSASQYHGAGRPELAATEEAEIEVLKRYLPGEMSAAEVEALVQQVIAELSATSKKQMGAVVKRVQELAAGRTDGKTVSTIVGKLLS